MRSRPALKVYLNPLVPRPGDTLLAEARLVARSETPVDSLDLALRGTESIVTGSKGSRTTRRVVALAARLVPGRLAPGEHRFPVRFELPATLPPSYAGSIARVEYELDVRVGIPWWPDRRGRYVVVLNAPDPGSAPAQPRSYCTSAAGPRAGELYIEASLDRTRLEPGGTLSGAVAFANVKGARLRRVVLAFVATERPRVPSSIGTREVSRFELTLAGAAPDEGAAVPFRVRLPPEAPTTCRASTFELAWTLEITAVVAWGTDRSLYIPLEVVPPARAAGQGAAPRWVAPVGRERRALVWSTVAEQQGFANDPELERMHLTCGAIALTVGLTQRGEQGSYLVARLAWPVLGIDLAVTERRWTDAFQGTGLDFGDRRFERRTRVVAREAAQAHALLDASTRQALLAFDEVRADDHGAELTTRGTAHSVPQLASFVTRAVACARHLAAGIERIPPPDAMREHAPAWRAYAGRVGGRFVPGSMSILDAMAGLERFDLQTRWLDPEGPECTELSLRLDPPIPSLGSASDPAALPPAARDLADELHAAGGSLQLGPEALVLRLPGPLADPDLTPRVAQLARLARTLRGDAERGPFR